jgi:hypothetical protein
VNRKLKAASDKGACDLRMNITECASPIAADLNRSVRDGHGKGKMNDEPPRVCEKSFFSAEAVMNRRKEFRRRI